MTIIFVQQKTDNSSNNKFTNIVSINIANSKKTALSSLSSYTNNNLTVIRCSKICTVEFGKCHACFNLCVWSTRIPCHGAQIAKNQPFLLIFSFLSRIWNTRHVLTLYHTLCPIKRQRPTRSTTIDEKRKNTGRSQRFSAPPGQKNSKIFKKKCETRQIDS